MYDFAESLFFLNLLIIIVITEQLHFSVGGWEVYMHACHQALVSGSCLNLPSWCACGALSGFSPVCVECQHVLQYYYCWSHRHPRSFSHKQNCGLRHYYRTNYSLWTVICYLIMKTAHGSIFLGLITVLRHYTSFSSSEMCVS